MKRLLVSAALVSAGIGWGVGGSLVAQAADFQGAYRQALGRSEVLAAQVQSVEQARERHRQAWGAMLPTITGTAQYLRQSEPQNGASIFPVEQPQVRVSAAQPLFRGLRDFAGLSQMSALLESQVQTQRQMELTLYADTARAYFTAASVERDLENLRAEIQLTQQRVQELQSRSKIGRSRASEVMSAQASVGRLEAEAAQLEGTRAAARLTLEGLTGVGLQEPLSEPALETRPLLPENELTSAAERRPDVRAELARSVAADEAVAVARGGHLPSADLRANYYAVRTGALGNGSWDVTAELSLPLFAGLTVQSRWREAEALRTQAEVSLARVRRLALEELRGLRAVVEADQAQTKRLGEVLQVAEKAYTEQVKEYRLGLVTNIDVLTSLTTFKEGQRALDRSRYTLALDRERLAAALGAVAGAASTEGSR